MALLEVEGLAKRYADVAGHAGPEVLSGLDLSVESGEAVAIVGPVSRVAALRSNLKSHPELLRIDPDPLERWISAPPMY